MMRKKSTVSQIWFMSYHYIVAVLILYIPNIWLCNCEHEYNTSYQGANSIITTNTKDVVCSAFSSCMSSDIESNSSIHCSGSYSCYNTTIVFGPDSTSSEILPCGGLYSCASVRNLQTNGPNIHCHGELSCSDSNITVNGTNMYCYESVVVPTQQFTHSVILCCVWILMDIWVVLMLD